MRLASFMVVSTWLCTVSAVPATAQTLTGYMQPGAVSVRPADEATLTRPASLARPMLSVPEISPREVTDDAPLATQLAALNAPMQAETVTLVESTMSAVASPAFTQGLEPSAPDIPSLPEVPLASYEGAHQLRDIQPVVMAAATKPPPELAGTDEAPVDFEADNLQHDDSGQIITATGNVQLIQSGRILRAQKVVYNLADESAYAEGNVVLSDANGDIYFADNVTLTGQMREGVARTVRAYLGQGGRFTAKEIEKFSDGSMKLTDAAYTPCECSNDDEDNPAWEIKAKEVKYNKPDGRIKYKHAKFEIYGVPVMYTPYLSHSDGREKQKSGLLTPSAGFNSQLGYHITNQYYWAIAPDKDATVGVMLTSKKNPVGLMEYRQRFTDAEFQINASGTSSSRKDRINGVDTTRDEDARGHVFANGLWNINNKWRAGVDLELTSDDQYLRQYDFSNEDVLENQVYLERFSGRNYAVGRVLAFQDVRVNEYRRDQPDVLPEVIASFTGEPNAMLGGRWQLEANALGLRRGGDGQDMNRGVLSANWQRKFVSDTGFVSTVDLNARGDVYSINDSNLARLNPALDQDDTETRFFPQAHAVMSYPVARPFEKMQMVVEPMAALTIAPNVNSKSPAIPNEDSEDAQIDALNLFHATRFPGKDRIEDDSRVTYGLRTGFYGYEGSYVDVFGGQSWRFEDDDNPFPRGSGLDNQSSDFVGQVSGMYRGRYGGNYRFQLDSGNFSSQRHELDAYANWDRFGLSTRYLYATSLEDTVIDEAREQVEGVAYLNLTKEWRVNTGALYDLGVDPGLRKAAVGLDFMGCCMSFSLLAERNLTTDSSGDNGTEIKFRIGLDHLGQIESGSSSYWNNRRMTDSK